MIGPDPSPSLKSFSWSGVLRARHVALPAEHGSWIFLATPLLVGLFAGGIRPASLVLVVGVLAAFLARQPVTMAVKVFAGRRPRQEMAAVWFWLALYGLLGFAGAAALVAAGHAELLWLAVPALPVFAWHLWLVRRRAERRQMWVEMTAAGVLALAAPAAYGVGQGQLDGRGWLLWGLCWLQVAGTILYAYLRLEQRVLKQMPSRDETWRMGRAALIYHLAAFMLVAGLAAGQVVPRLLPLAYLIQLAEVAWGMLHPAVGVKPKVIGFRQLAVSLIFTAAFILLWLV